MGYGSIGSQRVGHNWSNLAHTQIANRHFHWGSLELLEQFVLRRKICIYLFVSFCVYIFIYVCVFVCVCIYICGISRWLSAKESASQCRSHKRFRFDPWVRKILGEGHDTLLQYSPWEKSHGERSLVGYSPWSHNELAMTEPLSFHASVCVCMCVYIKYT